MRFINPDVSSPPRPRSGVSVERRILDAKTASWRCFTETPLRGGSAIAVAFLLWLASFTVCAQTVPTPQFFPPSGTWVPANVTITCADAAAALHYTLDGSTPDANAQLYTGPLSVPNATTVLARAFRPDQTPSAVAMADYYEADLARIRKSVTNNATISPSVVLTVTPSEGVACYGVEATIPTGLEVTEVNIGGVWNVTNRTLRWGPYLDASPRLFTYSVREVFRLGVTNEIVSRISLNGGSFPPDAYNVTVTVQLAPPPPPVAAPVFNPPGRVALPATFSITSATTNGVVSLLSDDLELGTDTGVEQVMGLRFANVQVPKDAVILDTRVQFTQKEDKNVEPFGVVIRAEASGLAASFSTNLFDVSSRTGTVTSVLWTNVPAWTAYRESTTNQQTPNLAALVREVLARTNWLTGQGCRTALSYDGYAAQSPRLDITYAVTKRSQDLLHD